MQVWEQEIASLFVMIHASVYKFQDLAIVMGHMTVLIGKYSTVIT